MKVKREGFSLIELLIYIGIFSASVVFLVGILIVFTRIHVQQTAVNEVNNQVSFVNNVIQQKVRESSLIEMDAGVATSTITLRMSSSSLDKTLIYLDTTEKIIYLQEGSGSPIPLTNPNVSVEDFTATKYENPGGHAIVQVYFVIDFNTDNERAKFNRAVRTAISRVSAATFDSDVLPNANNSFDIGNSSKKWKDAYFSGNIGIGVSPQSGFRIKTTGDIAITTSTMGLILTAPNGTCFRLKIQNDGNTTSTSVACPS